MGLGDAFDALMDWTMEGNMVWSMTKFFGVSSLAAATLISPLFFIANAQQNAYKDELAELNNRPTVVFNSVADCVGKGYGQSACVASQKAATGLAGGLGTTLSYSSDQACAQNHRSCDAQTITTTTLVNAGNNVFVPITTTTTSYYPKMIGWQAERDDLNKAVPVYQGAQPGQGVRWDGKVMTLDIR